MAKLNSLVGKKALLPDLRSFGRLRSRGFPRCPGLEKGPLSPLEERKLKRLSAFRLFWCFLAAGDLDGERGTVDGCITMTTIDRRLLADDGYYIVSTS